LPTNTASDRIAAQWRLLGLIPGAPECVIKAAHRAHIELHHPDRGGDADTAKRINAAYDELKGRGTEANMYVANNYNGEPWVVLGISSASDARMVERAGKQLAAELTGYPRLASRVGWAMKTFAEAAAAPEHGRRHAPITPPPPPRRRPNAPAPKPRRAEGPSRPGMPEGLAPIDFGTVRWGDSVTRTMQLTWKHAAPYDVRVEVDGPIRAEVTPSKVLPGRFSTAFSIDWDADELRREPATRGYTLNAPITLRWTSQDWTTVFAKGTILYPAYVTASPAALDLGDAKLKQPVRVSFVVVSTAPTELTIEPTPWLQRVDAAGKVLDTPLKLATNTPVRIEMRVHWPPIVERGAASFDAGRPVRASGRIILRWDGRESEVAAAIVATKK
jgi:hypothetical protein